LGGVVFCGGVAKGKMGVVILRVWAGTGAESAAPW
jgi:hypothetical protein